MFIIHFGLKHLVEISVSQLYFDIAGLFEILLMELNSVRSYLYNFSDSYLSVS